MVVQIRSATHSDIPILADYWYDKVALLQQFNSSLRLAPQAQQIWQRKAQHWLQASPDLFLCAVLDNIPIGAIVGQIVANDPWLLPESVGQVQAFVLDMHLPQTTFIGTQLLDALCQNYKTHNIQQVYIPQAIGISAESAFWQGTKAQQTHDIYCLELQ
jgi:hypothetical protein